MKVCWTESALGHLDSIFDFIAQDSHEYAARMVDRITRRSQQLARFPRSGRAVPEYASPRVREVVEASYRIIYVVKDENVDVLAVLHGARDLKNAIPEDEIENGR